jgi:hypothetical protein
MAADRWSTTDRHKRRQQLSNLPNEQWFAPENIAGFPSIKSIDP